MLWNDSLCLWPEILAERQFLKHEYRLGCDAIFAMRELFLQIVYGRSQTAFSEGGLPIRAGLEDLGKDLEAVEFTMYSTVSKVQDTEMQKDMLRNGLDENGKSLAMNSFILEK